MDMSVDLPDPDDPMMATNSPRSTTKLTPRSACTCTSPMTKVRVTFSILRTGSCMSSPWRPSPRASEARQWHRLTVARNVLLGDDDLVTGAEISLDDLGEILVLEPEHDRKRNRRAVTQHPET